MKQYVTRQIEDSVKKYLKAFPVVGITGPRQSGKSTMLMHLLAEDYTYVSFDDFKVINQLHDDPAKFLRIYNNHIIFDEVHKAPELMDLIKVAVDNDRHNYGKYIITGSAQFNFMKGVSESLAGRIGLLTLLPFQFNEIPTKQKDDSIFKGGYPEQVLRNYEYNPEWYSSYIETYLNKDLRSLLNIGDLGDFRKFIQILASRCSQILNLSEVSRDIGISVSTIKRWLSVLEASYIVFLLPPFYNNYGKRLIKSPKLYFYDTGLVSYLLGIEDQKSFEKGPMYGSIFENYIVSEIVRKELHSKTNADLYFYRSSYGLEVDLIIDRKSSIEWLEIKASETFRSNMVSAIETLKGKDEKGFLLYNGKEAKYLEDITIINYKNYLK